MKASRYPDASTAVGIFGHSHGEYFERFGNELAPYPGLYQPGIYYVIDQMINDGLRTFLTGLESGVPCWLAEYVLMNKKARFKKDIELWSVFSSPDALNAMSGEVKQLATYGTYVFLDASEDNAVERFIVENSSRIISIHFDPEIEFSVRLARQAGKPIYSLNPEAVMADVLMKYF